MPLAITLLQELHEQIMMRTGDASDFIYSSCFQKRRMAPIVLHNRMFHKFLEELGRSMSRGVPGKKISFNILLCKT